VWVLGNWVGGTGCRRDSAGNVIYLPQQNVVRQDGMRSSMLSVLKNGSASTLDVASGVKAAMGVVLKTVSTRSLF